MASTRYFFIAVGLVLAFTTGVVSAQDFIIVVHASNPTSSITKTDLSQIYLKSVPKWDHGNPVVPVDLVPTSEIRATFSKAVHGRDVDKIKNYWASMIFSGLGVPPVELDTDLHVLEFVRNDPGAVGYISPDTTPGPGTKVLRLSDS